MEPIINLDDPARKIVGRRRVPRDPVRYGMALQASASEISQSLGGMRVPRGVFRFHSHEEADEWMLAHMTRPRKQS